MADTGYEFLGEPDEEGEPEGAFEDEAEELRLLFPGGARYSGRQTQQTRGFRCPSDTKYSIIGFGRYSDNWQLLPQDQKEKLSRVIQEISASFVPPATPVVVVGHADPDAARESREPGFLQYISEKRALAVGYYMCCLTRAKLKENFSRIRWRKVGRGARAPVVRIRAPRRNGSAAGGSKLL